MIATRLLRYEAAPALIRGLRQLREQGVRGRALLFLALDERGAAHLAIAEDLSESSRLKIGMKLALPWPFSGRVFYFDAVHPIGRHTAVVNGDRRIGHIATLIDATELVSGYVERMDGESVFFGCTPHQPGSWWIQDQRAIPLHERGFVEIVPCRRGLVARRTFDDGLYFLSGAEAVAGEIDGWQRVFDSPLGNILMVERRTNAGRLALSCQRGLVEIDLADLPRVSCTGQIQLSAGYAVVGRITEGAFAVTRGEPRDWGFDELRPAILLGSKGSTFEELGELLQGDPLAV